MNDSDLSRTAWRKSSYSNGQGGNCTEVAAVPGGVAIRDSKFPDGPALKFAPEQWRAFVATVRDGDAR